MEDMMNEFQREERYIVVKRKHMSAIQETALRAHLARLGIGTIECAVIESDWPEYETVWKMIEARVTGKPDELATTRAELAASEGRERETLAVLQTAHESEAALIEQLAAAHATIHQLGENAAKAAGEYAEEVGRLRAMIGRIIEAAEDDTDYALPEVINEVRAEMTLAALQANGFTFNAKGIGGGKA